MKSILKYLLFAVIATTLIPLSSCFKKGKDDPFISFRSRTARLTGVWKLSSFDYTSTKVNRMKLGTTVFVTTITDHFVYDGTTTTQTTTTVSGNAPPTVLISKSSYSETWTIDKANTYTSVTVLNATSTTTKGSWAWMNKDKDAGLKNKEAIVLLPEKYTQINTSSNGKTDQPVIIVLDELKNTQIITTMDESTDDGMGDNNGTITTRKGTMTYNQ